MKNCIENNFNKITAGISARLTRYKDTAYKPILEYLRKSGIINDIDEFYTYIAEGRDGNINYNALQSKIVNLATKVNPEINPINVLKSLASTAEKLIQEPVQTGSTTGVINTETYATEEIKEGTTEISEIEEDVANIQQSLEVSETAEILKISTVKDMSNVYNTYLIGELVTATADLNNYYQNLLSREWLSTEEGVQHIDNFDHEVIKGNIKRRAKNTIKDYYTKGADAILTFTEDFGLKEDAALLYLKTNRLPVDSSIIREIEIDGVAFNVFKSKAINSKGDSTIFISPKNNLSVEELLNLDLDLETLPSIDLDETAKQKRIDKETVSKEGVTKRMKTVYFAHIVLNELDIFVDSLSKELSSMYVETFRKGPLRVDKAGSSMATRMTKLGIKSTPRIHAKSDGTKILNKIKAITRLKNKSNKSVPQLLFESGAVEQITFNGVNILTNANGMHILLNVGAGKVLFSNINKEWVIVVDGVNYNTVKKLRDDAKININNNIAKGINEILSLLNADLNSDPADFSNLDGYKSVNDPKQVNILMQNINSKENLSLANDTLSITTFTGEDRFLKDYELTQAADILDKIPHDFDEAGDYLLAQANNKKNGTYAQVARSLYYKYFHRGEYTITEENLETGEIETHTQHSVYEKALRYNDAVSWNALISLLGQLNSTVIDDKVFMSNDYLVRSMVKNVGNADYLISNIDSTGMHVSEMNSIAFINSAAQDVNQKFTVRKNGNKTIISYFKNGKKPKGGITPDPTVKFTISNTGLTTQEGKFNYEEVKDMLLELKLPLDLSNINFYDALKIAMSDVTAPGVSLDTFYGKVIALRLANVIDSTGKYIFSTGLSANNTSKVRYKFASNMIDFEAPIRTALSTSFSRSFSSQFKGPGGNTYALSIYQNLSKRKKQIVDDLMRRLNELPDSFLYKNSALITKDKNAVITGSLTRLGVQKGEEGKNNSKMNKQELMIILINSFIQHAGNTGFKEGLSGEGTMADRSKIDSFIMKVLGEDSSIAPSFVENGFNKLDEIKLREAFFDTQERAFKGLQDHFVLKWNNIFNTINVDSSSFKLIDGSIPNIIDTSKITTIRDVYNVLQILKLDYQDLLQKSGLVNDFTLTKAKDGSATIKYSLVNLSEIVLAEVPKAIPNNSKKVEAKLQQNLDRKNFYLDMYYNQFLDYTEENDYKISPREIALLENKFPYLKLIKFEGQMKSEKQRKEEAKKLALKIFFYNDSRFEQELIQFGMGHVFQYGSKESSMFEKLDGAEIKSNKTLLKAVSKYDFGNGITISNSYEQLQALGKKGTLPGFIKKVVESNMSDKDKVELLRFHDIFTQISPMYIARVKRNQGSGTSGVNPILSSTNKPGAFVDNETHTILADNDVVDLFSLGKGAMEQLDLNDGIQYITPDYAIKLNNSLGNKFSNFRGKAFFKTVNVSADLDGIRTYEKLMAISYFTPELMTYGSAAHSSIYEFMMGIKKFSDFDENYDGLYLPSKNDIIKQEGEFTSIELSKTNFQTNYKNYGYIDVTYADGRVQTLHSYAIHDNILNGNINIKDIVTLKTNTDLDTQEFLKHGEYLGKVIMKFNDGTAPKNKEAVTLINDIAAGRIDTDTIESIQTDKIFVPKEVINSRLDLFNYFGGKDTELDILNSLETEEDRDEFVDEFPFGWVEYQLTNIMSNYRGDGVNYPIRNATVNKLQFKGSVKTGQKNMNPKNITTKKDIEAGDIATHTVSNKNLTVVLQLESEYDATADQKIRKEENAAKIKMMTQVIGAAVAEGDTKADANAMNKAIADLSDIQLYQLEKEVAGFNDIVTNIEGDSAEKQYAVDMLRVVVATKKDPGDTRAILGVNEFDAAKVPLDLKRIAPMLSQSINSEFSKRGIELRFPGHQYALAPVHDLIKMHDYKGAKLMRSSLNSENSLNGVISKEVTEEGFDGFLQDSKWTLDVIPSIKALKQLHTTSDIVYKISFDKAGKAKYTAHTVGSLLKENTRPQELAQLEQDLNAGTYYSPWIAQNAVTEGENLQYINYYKNGESLYDSDEYKSFLLAAEAPKKLIEIETKALKSGSIKGNINDELAILGNKLDYFDKNGGVPQILWSRFINTKDANEALIISPVLGKHSLSNNYKEFLTIYSTLVTTGDVAYKLEAAALLEEFFGWIEDYAGNEQNLTSQVRPQLVNYLQEDGWTSRETEFYMPPHHQAAYMIKHGTSLQDIVGTDEQPNIPKLASILGLTKEEIILLEKNYIYNSKKEEVIALRQKIESKENCEECVKYLDLRQKQQVAMLSYFGEQLKALELDALKSGELEPKVESALIRKAPTLVLLKLIKGQNYDVDDLVSLAGKMIKYPEIMNNGLLFELLSDIVKFENPIDITADELKSLEIFKRSEWKRRLELLHTKFIVDWKSTAAANFEKSLTFITSRIPAAAKQNTTIGKIKGFIYSTGNAIYSPVEVLAMSGGDHDGDKQYNITWGVDSMGKIIDWEDYVDIDGSMHIDLIKNEIKEAGNELRSKLNDLGYNKVEINKMVTAAVNAKLNTLAIGTQNYIAQKLMHVYMDPKNAIETATVTAMNKLGVIKDYLSSFNFSDSEIDEFNLTTEEVVDPTDTSENPKKVKKIVANKALLKALKIRQLALPYTPSSKMLYEKINMDGKFGISIFASAIKAYYVAFNAWINNDSVQKFTNRANEGIIDLDSRLDDLDNVLKDVMSTSKATKKELEYIQFKDDNGKPLTLTWIDNKTGEFKHIDNISTLANTKKFIPKHGKETPVFNSIIAKNAYAKLKLAVDEDTEMEILLKFKEQMLADSAYNSESQAWSDLSELLNAATDNAKELTLGVIGADGTTSSIIATMVVMGIDMNAALALINDPLIKEVIKEVDNDKSLYGGNIDFVKSFRVRLEAKSSKYKAPSAKIKEDIKQKVILRLIDKGLTDLDSEDSIKQIDAEVKKQIALYTKYNPYKQVALYAKAASEFSALAGTLDIITGMKNTDVDIFNYILKLERAIKGPIEHFLFTEEERNILGIGNIIPKTSRGAYERSNMIDNAENKKIAFNIPYIISKNKHLISYLKTMYSAVALRKNISYTTNILYDILKPMLKKKGKIKVTEEEMYKYIDLLSNVAVTTYYTENKVKAKLPVGGKFGTYDLSKGKDRLAFISNIGAIKDYLVGTNQKLRDNEIVKELQANVTRVDKLTGKTLMLLSGINTDILEDGAIANYKQQMEILKQESPELHSVLYNYSLIVDKGGLGRNAIAMLFHSDVNVDFNNHVVDLHANGSMQNIIDSINPVLLGTILPMTLQEITTHTNEKNNDRLFKINKDSAILEDAEDAERFDFEGDTADAIQEAHEMMQEQLEELLADGGYAQKELTAFQRRFDTNNIDDIKNDGILDIDPIVISKTNGYTYRYMEALKGYVPINVIVPTLVGNIDVTDSINNELIANEGIDDIGYDWGWEIVLPDGNSGRLLKYNPDSEKYYVLTKENKLEEHTGAVLLKYNPQFLLSKSAIMIKRGGFTPKAESVLYINKSSKKVSNTNVHNSYAFKLDKDTKYIKGEYTMTTSNITDIPIKKTSKSGLTYENLVDGIYDSVVDELFTRLGASVLESNIDIVDRGTNILTILYNNLNANKTLDEFPKFLQENPTLGLLEEFKNTLLEQENKEKLFMFLRLNADEKLNYLISNVLKDNTIVLSSISNLQKRDSEFDSILNNFESNKGLDIDAEFIASKNIDSITVKQYLSILNKLGISNDIFRKANRIDLLVVDGVASYAPTPKTKIKRSVSFTDINSKMDALSPKIVKKLGSYLNSRFKNTEIKVMTVAEIASLYPDIDISSNDEAFIVTNNNTIIMIQGRATTDTMLHEMGHIYLAELREKDSDMYYNILDKMKNDPLLQQVADTYKNKDGYSEDSILEEVFVIKLHKLYSKDFVTSLNMQEELSAMKENGSDFISNIENSFSTLFSEFFGNKSKDLQLSMEDSILDIMKKIGADIVFNKNSQLYGMIKSDKVNIKRVLQGKGLTKTQAIKYLMDAGLIRKICN